MEEIWKPVKDFENYYEVSNLGRVRTIPRVVHTNNGGHIYVEQFIKAACTHYKGYLQTTLKVNGNKYRKFIHRLVAETFLPNPNGYKYINHKDEDKTNNKVENLEWCTAEYNNKYGTRLKRIADSHRGKPTHNSIKVIIDGIEYQSITDASKQLGISFYKLKKNLNI